MVKVLIGFELLVGVLFLLLVVLFYLLLAGYTSGVGSIWDVCLYWGGLSSGPLLLVIGAVLSALGKRIGPPVSLAGASILTVALAYELLDILKTHDTGDNPYMPYFLGFAVILALATGASAYFVMKLKGGVGLIR